MANSIRAARQTLTVVRDVACDNERSANASPTLEKMLSTLEHVQQCTANAFDAPSASGFHNETPASSPAAPVPRQLDMDVPQSSQTVRKPFPKVPEETNIHRSSPNTFSTTV
eukprot:TRINITY_DN8783_c0_g1_i1.p1 TRINITY_DN8783_c0_g1~~TRINITY_DN8783_c0_g1_i1.p1  ORF type:complete len:127 (-),score=19.99 TRINITY_DN8783_c0_g1_i1:43-378(-)